MQDPEEAEAPSMPLSAMRYVDVDHSVALRSMGILLYRLASESVVMRRGKVPELLRHEQEMIVRTGDFMDHLQEIGKPSTFVCPDCAGSLWEIDGTDPRRFRCHTGHGYTLRSLQHAQSETTDDALWSALRALQEKEMLLKTMADSHRAARDPEEADRLDREADETAKHGQTLRRLIESGPTPSG